MVENEMIHHIKLKNLLIISPYFPPVNAADMQRVRMSLPYFADHGWNAEVVIIDENYTDMGKDPLLLQSIPQTIKVHKVKALDKKWTSKLGLGIALRSLPFYRKKVNELLKTGKYDLIYFSTTQFPVCILGNYWKKRFGIPYVIDMQDPWHSDYYKNKPKDQQPPKYWFSYRLNKYLEPIAMKNVDGLISVSEKYIDNLKNRYPKIASIPAEVITFGAFEPDLKIANNNRESFPHLLKKGFKNIAYIGRGGNDMHKALNVLFEAFKEALTADKETFKQLQFYFIGTSYAPSGQGTPSIVPLAKQYGIEDHVIEITDRISYYHTLATLQQADGLFIPGSDDPAYTASKIYPYLLTQKPILAIFNKESSAVDILKDYGLQTVYSYQDVPKSSIIIFFKKIINGDTTTQEYNKNAVKKYSAANMALKQCELFNKVINGEN
jgi:hypothetical protein